MNIHWLDPNPNAPFPDVEQAFKEPDGLLAAGGDLSPPRLLNAYSQGIFPWYSPGEPILWWSPDPRCVLFPEKLKISRSLKRTLKKDPFDIHFNTAFADVMRACAEPRPGQDGTWISDDMLNAYIKMHELGYAHSVECWQDGKLVGGLYGMLIGKVFFGESMFSRVSDASKVALVYLCEWLISKDVKLIDSQVHTAHLERMGAEMIPRREFVRLLRQNIDLSHSG
ncbi:MAG TPA: leucyl/phenylalanyl-tRNA--protein transferase [Gammaproteobacteria bacterium]|nr:leucyl/phenylalanyl-tRNA--protein transferase [Gammaproteobacteria bacterium]